MEYVKLCLGEQIDKLKENIEWCKANGYTDGAGNYEYQLKQFQEALKILSNVASYM